MLRFITTITFIAALFAGAASLQARAEGEHEVESDLVRPAATVAAPGQTAAAQDSQIQKWFPADSFSFGVEREMKESGEKGGTEDINIGVGELQEMSLPSRPQ